MIASDDYSLTRWLVVGDDIPQGVKFALQTGVIELMKYAADTLVDNDGCCAAFGDEL